MVYSRPSVRQTSRPPVAPPAWPGSEDAGGARSVKAPESNSWVWPVRRAVDGEDLVRADLDLVAVQHGGGIGAQADAVDDDLGVGRAAADRGGALGGPLHDGMPGQNALALEQDGAARRGPYDRLTDGHGDSCAAEFELHHRSNS